MTYRGLIAGVLAVAGLAGTSDANDNAFIITNRGLAVYSSATQLRVNPSPYFRQLGEPERDAVGLIHAPVLVPEATVDPAVADTPALPHLAKLKVGETTVLIDPRANYQGKEPGGLDEGHSIIRAQRLHEQLRPRGAYVIRRGEASAPDTGWIQPRAILLRPDLLEQLKKHQGMPVTPKPQKIDRRQMVMAD